MKKGQIKLSFGMIFSIILIIIFIGFTFYAITKFLELQDSIKISTFQKDLQDDIDKLWKSSQGSQEVEYLLPSGIEEICFLDDEYENLVFHGDKLLGGGEINHIDIEKTLNGEESLCIANVRGKVSMTIKKDYGEALVEIVR